MFHICIFKGIVHPIILSLITLTLVSFQTRNTFFVHLQKPNYDIFDEIQELSDPDSNTTVM